MPSNTEAIELHKSGRDLAEEFKKAGWTFGDALLATLTTAHRAGKDTTQSAVVFTRAWNTSEFAEASQPTGGADS